MKNRIHMVKKKKSPGKAVIIRFQSRVSPTDRCQKSFGNFALAVCIHKSPTSSHDTRNQARALTTTHRHIKLTQPPEISREVTVINRDTAPRPIVAEGKSFRRRSHGSLVVGWCVVLLHDLRVQGEGRRQCCRCYWCAVLDGDV
jgi:hypothetical protein